MSLPRNVTTFSAALLLELLLVMVLERSLRSGPPAPGIVLVFVSRGELLQAAHSAAPSTASPPGRAALVRIPLQEARVPDWRSLPLPSGNFPPAAPRAGPRSGSRPDWSGAAHAAAADAAKQAMLTRQRLAALDELADDSQHRTHASFPWSHQPLTPWFDFDTHTLTSIFHLGKHCEIVFVLILPGFGCVLGHLDDEARGDLFDPALLPGPLQLPAPAIPVRHNPWSVPGPDASTSPGVLP